MNITWIVRRWESAGCNAERDTRLPGVEGTALISRSLGEEFIAANSFEIVGNSAAEFTSFIKADRGSAGRPLPSPGVKPQQVPK